MIWILGDGQLADPVYETMNLDKSGPLLVGGGHF